MEPRISLRPDFQVHIFDQSKVVFFSEEHHFLLQNQVFVDIVKELKDPHKTTSEIINKLSPLFSSELIISALDKMINRFILEVKPSKFSQATLAFWHQHPNFLENQQKKTKISIKKFGNIDQTSTGTLS